MTGLVGEVAAALDKSGVDLSRLGLAWARVAPSVALVPAFGLRAFPGPARVVLALALAASVAPGLPVVGPNGVAWPVALLVEVAKGLPIAVTASVALWVASMTGGAIDDLRGARETSSLPTVEAGATPLGALFGLLTSILFLESGGPGRIVQALSRPDIEVGASLFHATQSLVGGIELALAIAAPILVASVVIEVAGSLVARAASPAFIGPLLAPVRSLGLLAVTAVVLERMLELLAILAARPV
ncbi:MAG: flagellar biosynthetic protein FliR [Myxococcales bacterium]|nr:flagellar biosynthetic protein FliR [Myxococcales bacterium]